MVDDAPPLSWGWVAASAAVILLLELIGGGLVADMLAGRQVSHMLGLRIEVLLSVGSFFVGGFVIGIISPGVRVVEPAIGAALSAVCTFLIALFSPYLFLGATTTRVLGSAVVAFLVALFGAHLGERITGN